MEDSLVRTLSLHRKRPLQDGDAVETAQACRGVAGGGQIDLATVFKILRCIPRSEAVFTRRQVESERAWTEFDEGPLGIGHRRER